MSLFCSITDIMSKILAQKWKAICMSIVILAGIMCGILIPIPPAFLKYIEKSCKNYLEIICHVQKGLFKLVILRMIYMFFFIVIGYFSLQFPQLFIVHLIFLFLKLYFFSVFLKYFLIINGMFGVILSLFMIIPCEIVFDLVYCLSQFYYCFPNDGFTLLIIGGAVSCLWEFIFILLFFRISG